MASLDRGPSRKVGLYRNLIGAAIFLALLFGANLARSAEAGPTDAIVACISGAADDLVQCTQDLAWYAEALCYARYASDGILCGGEIVNMS